MANIKSVGGNPIVLGLDGLTDDAKAAFGNGRHSAVSESLLGTPDTAQWAQRVTAGSDAATVRSVQGAAVGWNQLNQNNRNSTTFNGVTFTNNNDGTWTASGTATSETRKEISTVPRETGHKYLVRGCPSGGSASTYCVSVAGGVHDVGNGYIYASPLSTSTAFYIVVYADTTVDNLVFTPQLFDLTQMFGAGNEPTTVAEFERMYPEPYYPYSAPTLMPVRISGIQSTDAQGGELDAIEWTAQTLRAAGSVADMLYSDHVDVRVGVVDLGTLTWTVSSAQVFYSSLNGAYRPASASAPSPIECALYTAVPSAHITDKSIALAYNADRVFVKDSAYSTPADFKAAMQGVMCFYALATPTTTPISPALPMTYRVEQGGSESIIVPDGEVSAAPIITLAEGESAADVVMDALACIATPDGPVATANHALGTYLTMGGKLYKVTSAIAVGETIAAGTNVSQTTVMDEILALN